MPDGRGRGAEKSLSGYLAEQHKITRTSCSKSSRTAVHLHGSVWSSGDGWREEADCKESAAVVVMQDLWTLALIPGNNGQAPPAGNAGDLVLLQPCGFSPRSQQHQPCHRDLDVVSRDIPR